VASSPSLLSFRLPKTVTGIGGGRVGGGGALDSSSSESLRVKSITSEAAGRGGCSAGGLVDAGLLTCGGDNSRLTSLSSSSDSDESPMVIVLGALGVFDGGGEIVRLTFCGEISGTPRLPIHVVEPIFPSSVCHSPSGSTMTSSTSSGTLARILATNLWKCYWRSSCP